MWSYITYFWRECWIFQQILWSFQVFFFQLGKYFSVILDSFALKLFSKHIILNFELVDNLILEHMIGIWIFYFKSEISFRLVDHFGLILCDSFREIFDNRVVVFILLWNNKFVSESFIIFFVLFNFLFKNGIFLLWEFELLLFSFKLKFKRGEFLVECFWGLLWLGLFDSESGKKFLFFEHKWILLVKLVAQLFVL